MVQTIKETISGLIGIVIREGDRFKLGDQVVGIPQLHPRAPARDFIPYTALPEIAIKRLEDSLNDGGLVVKALVRKVGTGGGEFYDDADLDVGLYDEDEPSFVGYRLVAWGDLFAVHGYGERYQQARAAGLKPAVIRYLKPETKEL